MLTEGAKEAIETLFIRKLQNLSLSQEMRMIGAKHYQEKAVLLALEEAMK